MISENISVIRWMSRMIGWKKLYIGILLLIQIFLGITGVIYAMLLRNAIDQAVKGHKREFLIAILVFAILVSVQILLRAAGRFLEEYSRSSMENCFKERLFSCLLKEEYGFVSAVHSGEWMSRLTSDTAITADGLTQILPGTAGMIVKLAGAMIMLLILEPLFGIILIPGGLLLLVLTYGFRKILKQLHKEVQEADGNLRILLQESLSSMLVIRAFVKEEQMEICAAQKMEAHRKARMRRNHFSNFCNVGFGTVMQAMYVIGAAAGGYGILTGTMTYGTFIAILQLIGQVQSPFANVTGYLPKYYAMLASAERLKEAERETQEKQKTDCLDMEKIHEFYQNEFEAISMENVSFHYQPPASEVAETAERYEKTMPEVIRNLNMMIRKEECVAFTGPSGCGKSTVLKLMMGIYRPDNGTINLVSSREREIAFDASYRRLFAYVPQGNDLMSGTIREIVSFSGEARGGEDYRIWKALDIACAKEFVEELEHGIDTLLGEKGMGLSEGQMQRLAIARAVFMDNPILLLDESTSALDEHTEKKLLGRLRAMTDKTVIIITHRPAALEICDRQIRYTSLDPGIEGIVPSNKS